VGIVNYPGEWERVEPSIFAKIARIANRQWGKIESVFTPLINEAKRKVAKARRR